MIIFGITLKKECTNPEVTFLIMTPGQYRFLKKKKKIILSIFLVLGTGHHAEEWAQLSA